MRDKYKIIGAILVAVIAFVLTRACSNYFSDRIREDVNNDTKVKILNELKSEYAKNWDDSICELFYEKINFKDFPLSKKFLSKYKNINDIFGGNVKHIFENEYFDSYSEDMKNILTVTVKTGKGYEQIAYQLHYIINDNNELDDIEILNSRVYEDENGSYPHYEKYHYYYDDPVTAADILCFPYRMDRDGDYYRIYVTEAFDKKFPDCQDDKDLKDGIVGDKNYLICGDVIQDKEYPNICYAEFLDVDYTKTYKITFEILDNGYINDATIELYKKEVTKDPEYVKEKYDGYKENVRWF